MSDATVVLVPESILIDAMPAWSCIPLLSDPVTSSPEIDIDWVSAVISSVPDVMLMVSPMFTERAPSEEMVTLPTISWGMSIMEMTDPSSNTNSKFSMLNWLVIVRVSPASKV